MKEPFKITTDNPNDWKDLQAKCAAILSDCGFNVTIEKSVETVRGSVVVDIYAEKEIGHLHTIYVSASTGIVVFHKTSFMVFEPLFTRQASISAILSQKRDFKRVHTTPYTNRIFPYLPGMSSLSKSKENGCIILLREITSSAGN